MNYISTRKNNENVTFKEATLNGLAKDGGLYFPDHLPQLPASFFHTITSQSNQEIAFSVLKEFTAESLSDAQLQYIINETLAFDTPTVKVKDNIYALELFHGPTKAFKDVGARFMSRCLSQFKKDKEVVVLVATSGDTGSAVANGFFEVPGISVKILFPKGKVSSYQEQQMTSLGKNIQAIEVNGTFDDCQALVKQAFNDVALRKHIALSSANSINVARLLPQMLYYFFAYKQLKSALNDKNLVVSVPSGNFGNLTAGLIAKKMGLPIKRFIAANNANDTFYHYLKTGKYTPKASVQTFSNAMDVGAPSNFERILHLYNHNIEALKKDICGFTCNDPMTLSKIKSCYKTTGYLPDPHGAVGLLALEKKLKPNEIGVFLETAHPQKFSSVIQKVILHYAEPQVNLKNCSKIFLNNTYADFVNLLKS